MADWELHYKCRMCEQIFVLTEDIPAECKTYEYVKLYIGVIVRGGNPGRIRHDCTPTQIGLADFLGAKEKKEST